MSPSFSLERARGCLLGLAIGDALGAPLEGLSCQQVKAHYGHVEDYVDGSRAWKRKPFRWRMPGLYTGDTQQAIVLADVVVRRGRIEPGDVAEHYVRMASPRGEFLGAHRAAGRSFRLVVQDLERGVSPEETGQDSAGIGAAVRVAPLAIHHGRSGEDEGDSLNRDVVAASLMTHRDFRSLAGALAVASACRRLLAGEEKTPSLLFRVAGDLIRAEDTLGTQGFDKVAGYGRHRRRLSNAIARVDSILDEPRDRAFAALVDEANRHDPQPACRRPTMGFPPACLPTCLYLLLTTESFEEAILEVVNLGGDADSAGAIVGALAGAHYGIDGIPTRLLDGLANRDGLERYASALAGVLSPEELPDLVETERRLTEQEATRRESLKAERQSGGDLGANRRV